MIYILKSYKTKYFHQKHKIKIFLADLQILHFRKNLIITLFSPKTAKKKKKFPIKIAKLYFLTKPHKHIFPAKLLTIFSCEKNRKTYFTAKTAKSHFTAKIAKSYFTAKTEKSHFTLKLY